MGIDTRMQYLEVDSLIDQSLDPYLFVREAYFQNRQHKMDDQFSDVITSPSKEEEKPSLYVDNESNEDEAINKVVLK